jgi:hypothetical protein
VPRLEAIGKNDTVASEIEQLDGLPPAGGRGGDDGHDDQGGAPGLF